MTVDLSKRLLMLGISSSVILNPVLAFADDDDDDERDNDRSDDRDSDRDDSSDENDDRSDDRDSHDDSSDDKDDEDDSEDDDNNKGRNRGSDDEDYDSEDDEDDSLDDIMSDDSKLRELQNQLNQGDLTPQQRERIQNILNEAREKFGLDDSVERMIREENARELSGEIEKSLIRNGWE